jgi:hypothetical protein
MVEKRLAPRKGPAIRASHLISHRQLRPSLTADVT